MNVQVNGENAEATFIVGETRATSTSNGEGLGQGISFTNTSAAHPNVDAAPTAREGRMNPAKIIVKVLSYFKCF
ncbi:hypothetical protein PQX77_010247 [Marasmius sp. AFHP31]|nr:hypothetical protein PQX77_010247 [Marasmius sp. AFHP31]